MSNATDIRQSGGTAGSVDHTDTSLAVSRTIPVRCIVPRSRSVLMARM